jgi:hypothetical protein
MSETIFEEVRADLAKAGNRAEQGAERVLHRIEASFGHGHYDGAQVTETPKEPAMAFDLAQFAADARSDITTFMDNASSDWNRAKTFVEEKLPAIEDVASKVSSDPLFQMAYDDTIPGPARALIAEIGAKIKATFPAETPTAPAAPAEGDSASGDEAAAPAADAAAQPADQAAAPAA